MPVKMVVVSVVSDDISEAMEIVAATTAMLLRSPEVEIEETGTGSVVVSALYRPENDEPLELEIDSDTE